MKKVIGSVLALLFSVATSMNVARADDTTSITDATVAVYYPNIVTSANWTNTSINEVNNYAVFYATGGMTPISAVLQNINGTWQVLVVGKGIFNTDMLSQSLRVPAATATALLEPCSPEIKKPQSARSLMHHTRVFRGFIRMPGHIMRLPQTKTRNASKLYRPMSQAYYCVE